MRVCAKTRIVRVGNSQGLRIPKLVLQDMRLDDEVLLERRGEEIVIRPARRAREGWEAQFRAMAAAGDDRLLDAGCSTRWDREEWKW